MKYEVRIRETIYKFYSVIVETEDDDEKDFLSNALNNYSEDNLIDEEWDDAEIDTYVKLEE